MKKFSKVVLRFKCLPMTVWFAYGLTGCAVVSPHSSHSSFASYAESVFRHQNELSSRLMMLSEADELPNSEVFENAEEAMSDACYLLNEYAERENSGENISWRFEAEVQASIEGCDASIQQMETLLSGIRSGG